MKRVLYAFLALMTGLLPLEASFAKRRCYSSVKGSSPLMPYVGPILSQRVLKAQYRDRIIRARVEGGKIVSSNGRVIRSRALSQFVVTDRGELLITKKPAELDHARLGKGKPVRYAGLMVIENGQIIELVALATSSYSGSPASLRAAAIYFESLGVNLSQTRFSVAYFSPISSRKSEDQIVYDSLSYDEFFFLFH